MTTSPCRKSARRARHLSTGHGRARSDITLSAQIVRQFAVFDAIRGSFISCFTVSQLARSARPQSHTLTRSSQIPIATQRYPRVPSRGFLPWRLSDAGHLSMRHGFVSGRRPKTLHKLRSPGVQPGGPLCPQERTWSSRPVGSEKCQLRTFAPQKSAAIRLPREHWRSTRANPAFRRPSVISFAFDWSAPSDPRRYCKCRIGLKQTRRRLTGLKRRVRDGRRRMRDTGKLANRRGSDVGLSSLRRLPRQSD